MILAVGPSCDFPGFLVWTVAKEMQVGKDHVHKVAQELDSGDGIIDPRTVRHHCARGPGSLTLDDFDLCVLILLLRENPSRSLESYCRNLFNITGTTVSNSTVSRVWTHAFEIEASLLKPNHHPTTRRLPHLVRESIRCAHSEHPTL
jgi:hypothetical protein